MKYYFYMVGKVVGSLRRINLNSNPVVLERWEETTGKWVFSPETIAITGLGSDADTYKQITKAEAEKYMKKKRSLENE